MLDDYQLKNARFAGDRLPKKVVAIRHPVNGYRLYRRIELAELLEKLRSGK